MMMSSLYLSKMRKTMINSLFQYAHSSPLNQMMVTQKLYFTQREAAGGQTETNKMMALSMSV